MSFDKYFESPKKVVLKEDIHQYLVDGVPHSSVSELMRPVRKLAKDGEIYIARGKQVHDAIEVYLKTGIVAIDDEYMPWFNQFLKWWSAFSDSDEEIQILSVEQYVVNSLLGYAGTADLIVKKGNSFYLIDFKTTTCGTLEMSSLIAQLSAYNLALREMSKQKIALIQLAVQLTPTKCSEIAVPYDPNIVIALVGVKRFYLKWSMYDN